MPGAANPNLDDDPALFKPRAVSAPPFACKPKREDDPMRERAPGVFSAVASLVVVRSVELRPVLPIVFFSSVELLSLVNVEFSVFYPGIPAFLEVAVVFAMPVSPCLSLRSSNNFAYFSLILSAFEIILLWPDFPGLPAVFNKGDLASA